MNSSLIVPFQPLYHGAIYVEPYLSDFVDLSKSLFFNPAIISTGLNYGTLVDQPVPIPAVPLTNIIGMIGI